MTEFPYVWVWRHRTAESPYPRVKVPWFGDGVDRTGQRCQVVCRGTMNSALIKFVDGFTVVTSRGGLRKAPTTGGTR